MKINRKWLWIQPGAGEFFGFASMIDQSPRHTSALVLEEAVCVEVERNDIMVLLQRKPLAGRTC
jgi:CRP/FNR family transcriptional regulator, cyclic AMP receptor protein